MNMWTIYLLLKLDAVSFVFGFLTFVNLALIVWLILWYNDTSEWSFDEPNSKETKRPFFYKCIKPLVLTAISLLFLTLIIPTTDQVRAIYVIPTLAINP